MIFIAFSLIGVTKDIECKHIELIKVLTKSENGKKIDLPMKVTAIKEYDYITLINKYVEEIIFDCPFKTGVIDAPNGTKISVKKVKNITNDNSLYIDGKKLPKDARWRLRENGDVFEKFGGGTKKLKSYLIDQKYPQRLRANLPVLAFGGEVFVIAGMAISNKVRIDDVSTNIYRIEVLENK